jgi:[acyl-carrier-protein] S-malonyltransferase
MFSLTGWLRRSMLSRCVDPADVIPFLPRILADHCVARGCVQRYADRRALPRGVGMTIFHAEHDDRVTPAEAQAWTQIGGTVEQVRYCLLPGQDHFFCDSEGGRELAFEQIEAVLGTSSSRDASDARAVAHTLVLFPGQGSHEEPGLVAGLEGAREWKQAEDVLGYDLLRVCRETPAELERTRIVQAAIYVASYLRWREWADANRGRADHAIFAGFSLGEVTALVAAGVFTFAQGLRLVRVRGEAMERACVGAPSAMVTVVGLPQEAVSRVVQDINLRRGEDCSWLCNELWDEGFVVGVRQEEVARLHERARAAGARQTLELKVEGAFHTPLMRDAQRTFTEALGTLEGLQRNGKAALRTTVYSNVTGAPYGSVGDVFELLPQQIGRPVLWRQALAHAGRRSERITSVILPGPGKQLAGMLKRQSSTLYRMHSLIGGRT